MEQKEIIVFIIVVSIAIAIFITAIVLFVVFYQKKVVLQKKEKQKMKFEHQQELLSTQIEIQNQTMQHIGREIHDNIGQKLTLASLYAQQLAYENKAPHINENIENISKIINQSLTELRELSKSLTDNTIENTTISKLIKTECDKINEVKKCKLSFVTNDENLKLSYQYKVILFRITQEFIQNSIKHSKCKSIEINLKSTFENITLILNDDGIGFDTLKNYNGIGIINMKKRTELLGGDFLLESTTNKGTTLSIKLPI